MLFTGVISGFGVDAWQYLLIKPVSDILLLHEGLAESKKVLSGWFCKKNFIRLICPSVNLWDAQS
jgi:hypothetical protein